MKKLGSAQEGLTFYAFETTIQLIPHELIGLSLHPSQPILRKGLHHYDLHLWLGGSFTGIRIPSILSPLKLEIFTLCDSAVDYGGKVCILGAFDSVAAAEAPYTVTHCAVVARMRFHRIEEGNHKLRVTLADQDGKMIMPNVDAQVGVRFTEQAQSATFNLVMQINGLKLDQFGEYTVDLAVDGVHHGSLPLYFGKTPQAAAAESES